MRIESPRGKTHDVLCVRGAARAGRARTPVVDGEELARVIAYNDGGFEFAEGGTRE
jgi:hypothetical protein